VKYGLKPVTSQPRLRLADYVTSDLPSFASLPDTFGNPDLIQPEMFMNDTLGCCDESGTAEEIRYLNQAAGVTVNFTDASIVENYSAVTGYNPDDPSTDQGTDVHQMMEYRKTTGFLDADNQRHTIIDYVGLTPGDWDEAMVALWLFGVVGIGIQATSYIQQQFSEGQPWHLVPGRHSIDGGHYVPLVARTNANTAALYTWGGVGGIESNYYHPYCTVAVVSITKEMFTPEGAAGFNGAVDFDKLAADLPQLNTGTVSAKAPRSKRGLPRVKVSVDGVDQGPGEIGTRPDDSDPGVQVGGFDDAEPADR
jgi:hypothetical protein